MNLDAFVQVQETRIRQQLRQINTRLTPNIPEHTYKRKRSNPAMALLSPADVANIRTALSHKHERGTMSALAKHYKVSYSAIWNIARKRTWNA